MWIELAQATSSDRFGGKAARLSAALRAGLPVVPGWVLPVETALRLGSDAQAASAFAHELLAPDGTGWILRSSSPLEDRPSFSAAGLLRSEGCEAVPEAIAAALQAVVRSGVSESVRALFGGDAVPVAVLAQPRLRLSTWLTVEVDAGLRLAEGWTGDGARVSVRSLDAADGEVRQLVELALQAADGPSLVEVGHDGEQAWLLQVRPAPTLSPAASTSAAELRATLASLPHGLGLHAHPGDEDHAWVWDAEHSPTPLCPLLAGLFGEWLADGPASYPSRLQHGRWHDRAVPSPRLDLAEASQRLQRWEKETAPSLLRTVEELRARTPIDWPRFTADWLAWQRRYFDQRPAGLRSWAREVLASLELLPPLPETIASRRTEAWRRLAARVEALALPRSGEALRRWVDDHPGDALAVDLLRALRDDGHLAALPYDGRARTWEEDSTPFWRHVTALRGAPAPDPRSRVEASPEVTLAMRALALGEDDNDLLLRAYAAFRRAARSLVEAENWEWILDVWPEDLRRAASVEELHAAAARGRALWLQWEAKRPGPVGTSLEGTPASGGRAEGPVWRGESLSELPEGDGWIAVVATVTPADAHHFPRLAALVCEGGDVLGHASVLAREHGVPCVVGLADARRLLAGAREALVDANRGRVEPRLD